MTAPREHARSGAACPLPIAAGSGYPADSQPATSRAKVLRLELSRAVRRAREQADLTQERLADETGVSRSLVRLWEDPARPDSPNVAHVALAPRGWALPLLRWQAEQHALEVLESAADQLGDDDGARFGAVVRACANAQRAATLLVKPGVSATELRRCERDLLRAAEASLEAVQRVRRRLKEARGR